jgi:uncharacterized membrane protein YsdA (DUF1294 family)
MSDQTIRCVDCGRKFIWSDGEQRFYRERKLDPPRRCADCRSHRHNERETGIADTPVRRTPARGNSRASSTSPSSTRSATASDSQWHQGWPNPYKFYGLIGFFSTLIVAGIFFFVSHDLFWSYLIGINLVAFLMYGFDKFAAKAKWLRVPERVLIAPVWLLGFGGAEIGRRVFHHKTADVQFRIKYWLSAAITATVIIVYSLWSKL